MNTTSPLFVHSDLSKVFHLFRGNIEKPTPNYVAKAGFEFLKSIFPNELFFPAFNYDFGNKLIFDVDNDPVQVGSLPEYIRVNTDYIRSTFPFFSSLSKQKKFENIQNYYQPFGKCSVFEWMHKKQGYIIFFGAPFSSFTFLHYIENLLDDGPVYRYKKIFNGKVIKNKKPHDVICDMHVRPKFSNLEYDWDLMEKELTAENILRSHKLSNFIKYASTEDLVDFFKSKFEADRSYSLIEKSKKYFKGLTKGYTSRVRISDFE